MQALSLNRDMPLHTLNLLKQLLGPLSGRVIAVCGVSFLPESGQTRNSPTQTLVSALETEAAIVRLHDPYVDHWTERPELEVSQDLAKTVGNAEAVVLAVSHAAYTVLSADDLLAAFGVPTAIVDTFDIITDEKAKALHEAGYRLLGFGKGHWQRFGFDSVRGSDEADGNPAKAHSETCSDT
jgi:UDP-N-acetyl-D-mannosaminuronate dehydrogenase